MLEIRILQGDDFTAIYADDKKVYDQQGKDIEDILSSMIPHIVKCQSESEITVTRHSESDFDDEKIWIDGKGYIDSWTQVEAARLSS